MQLNSPGADALVSLKTPTPWWILPAGFVPAEPFHPKLTIVTERQVLDRVGKKFLAGDKEGATDSMHALLRAVHYPSPVARESVFIQAVPLVKPPTEGEA